MQTYIKRREPDTRGPSPEKSSSMENSMSAIASGSVRPTAEQMGHRVDLPGAIRAKMESAFGADFSGVELYESQTVADAGAQAMTMGNKIGFAPGELDFASGAGQALLGHELSHVVSQARGEVTGSGFLNDHALEARADREGALAAAGESVYSGPATPVSTTFSALSAAGPMQARKAKGKDELLSDNFDPQGTASDRVPKDPHNFLYESIFDTEEARRTRNTSADMPNWGVRGASREASSIGTKPEGQLKGNVYRPNQRIANGKHVIVCSGSGGSNQDQMGDQIKKYLEEGYTVHAYDYGGYGQSTTADGKVSEKSMQQDAQRIFDFVLANQGGNPIKAKDVLLHGFSMGGAMASHVVRNQAIKAAKAAGPNADDEKLGGLVLESSMRDTQNAAGSLIPIVGELGGAIGGSLYGQFDTMANLEEISKLDANLPVTFIGGSGSHDDHLAESKTGLYRDSKKRFRNVQRAKADKMDHLNQGKLRKVWDRVKENLMR